MHLTYVKILAEVFKRIFGETTGIPVLSASTEKGSLDAGKLPVAQVIEYQGRENPLKGYFILGFSKPEMALMIAAALAERMGLPKPEKINSVAIDLLAEFMNTVVGRTISAWDRKGIQVSFGVPSSLQVAHIQALAGFENQSYEVVLNMAFSKLVFHVNFSEEIMAAVDKGSKILVVEDSMTLRELLRKFLTEAGYEVALAEDGEQAVAMQRQEKPVLTLMDLVMPKMGGLDAIAAISEEDPGAKFIVLTSSDRRDEIVTATTLGVSDYLIKPVDKDRLLSSVNRVLEDLGRYPRNMKRGCE